MNQLSDQLQLQPNDQLLPHLTPNINYLNQVNMSQIVQGQNPIPLNGNLPINMQMPILNNQPQNDTSNFFYIIFILINF